MPKTKERLPSPTKRRVLLQQLATDEDTFQPRFGEVRESHIRRLSDTLGRGVELDPISVWEDPETEGRLVVADGHHRLEAHKRFGTQRVVVRVYRCDLATARILSVADNTKDRLELSYDEKAGWAWREVCEGDRTKGDIARLSGVSERSVAHMRATLKVLRDRGLESPDSWPEARRLRDGVEGFPELSADEREERRREALEKADRSLGAPLTELFQRWPEVAADLVERCAGGQLELALDYLGFVKSEPGDVDDAAPF